jgi:hypothetical protein
MRHIALVALIFLLTAPYPAVSQTVPGSISGRVVDGSRLPVADAAVRLIS